MDVLCQSVSLHRLNGLADLLTDWLIMLAGINMSVGQVNPQLTFIASIWPIIDVTFALQSVCELEELNLSSYFTGTCHSKLY